MLPITLLEKFFQSLFWITALLFSITLAPAWRNPSSRRSVAGFLVGFATLGWYLALLPPLSQAPHEYRSYIWGLLAPLALAFVGFLDFSVPKSLAVAGALLEFHVPASLWIAGLLLGLLDFIAGAMRQAVQISGDGARLLLWSLGIHVAYVCSGVFVVAVLGRVAQGGAWKRRSAAVALALTTWLACAWIVRRVVLAPVAFNSRWADLYAMVLTGCVLVYAAGSLSIILDPVPARSPLDRKRWTPFALLIVTACLFLILPKVLAPFDWQGVLQEIVTVALWVLVTMAVARLLSRKAPISSGPLLAMYAALAIVSFGIAQMPKLFAKTASGEAWASVLDRYSSQVPSARLLRDISSGVVEDESHARFFEYLQQNTNVATAGLQPVEVDLAGPLVRTSAPRPNIFILVVDSLRQDYVSTYNPHVDFTPEIAKFARESIVFRNAYTRYGGTTLAEASIWGGGMQLHGAFVQPHYAMNPLQKLADADGYQTYVTIDGVLSSIFRMTAEVVPLDTKAKYWTEFDLTHTTEQMMEQMEKRKAEPPVFFYSQPQNLHGVTLFQHGSEHPPKREYPGFHRLYASELERLDAGFGRFIDYLKRRGIYDDSIVILTSDHGDGLGELGRYGHVGSIYPNVMRVPLIMHIPERYSKSLVCDPNAVVFTADIAPTLYYLLGHNPIARNEIFGRPLLAASADELHSYERPEYMIASSYGAIYGILDKKGRNLFISDGVYHRNEYYDLGNDPRAAVNLVTPELIDKNEGLIRNHVNAINAFYGFRANGSGTRN